MEKSGDIPLRVLVVASMSARRTYLVGVTSQALSGVNVTSDSRISVARFAATKCDILVADLDTPASAAAMLDFLEDAPAGTGSVALIDDPDPAWVRSALRNSLNAVISRDATAEDMQLGLQAAEAGFVLLHPTSVRGLLQDNPLLQDNSMTNTNDLAMDGLSGEGVREDLTARETEVLRLVSLGLGNKEIAARLAFSEHTAKFHISSILSKLQAGSRTEAVSVGIRKGLIPI
ncbi:MAG: helix-turn-helix transcriptional regulator [Candidatus Angelobacter sp.]|nr:helix-turn-helix transcriptional regulator [Candidatus Angelobacter sp.]